MATDDKDVFERVIQLWNVPPAERSRAHKDLAYSRNPKISPEHVLADLRERFSEPVLRGAASVLLEGVVDSQRKGLIPGKREMFLAGCFLLVAEIEKGLPLQRDLVRDILTYFESVIWYRPVGDLVSAYLSESEVLDALRRGLAYGNVRSVRLSCLGGLRLYKGVGKRDASPEKKENALTAVRFSLAALERNDDPLIREAAGQARKALG
ncbi:MAG: hypothetical protein NEA02_01110 [Thermoanaerobaculia bacterium]|nr:hypothetical protein [Thermoanaerobaculia bacterium]